MNFDNYAGWCNSSSSLTDQTLTSDPSSFAYSPHDGLNLVEQINDPYFMTEIGGNYSSTSYEEKVLLQQMETQFGFLDNANETNNSNNLDSQKEQ
jgi:hypothetical protein